MSCQTILILLRWQGSFTASNIMANTQPIHNSSIDQLRQSQRPTGSTTVRSVRQDKGTVRSARIASTQPAPQTKITRARPMDTKKARSQNKYFHYQRTEKVTIWVKPLVKKALERIAQSEGLSISATGGAFLEKAIQSDIHSQHGALLETIIEQAIQKGMRAYSNRLASLLIRVAFASEQTRALVTNILTRQPGVTPELLKAIMDGSSNTAKRNITKRTPQLAAIIEEFEILFAQEGEAKSS